MSILRICLIYFIFLFHFETWAQNSCHNLFDPLKVNVGSYLVQNHRISYRSAGNPENPAILFIHGGPGHSSDWNYFFDHPNLKNKFHLIAVDRPGYGEFDQGKVEKSFKKQAELIIEVLKINQSQRSAIVVGYSLGGPIAARLAAEYPDKVSGLVMVSSLASKNLIQPRWYFSLIQMLHRQLRMKIPLQVFFEEISLLDNELIEMQPLWRKIQAQVFLMHGSNDQSVSVQNTYFLSREIPRDKLLNSYILNQVGHQILKTNPSVIVDALELLGDQ